MMLFKSFLDFSNLVSKGTHFIDSDWISQAGIRSSGMIFIRTGSIQRN